MKARHVVIVGAGIMGSATAFRLAQCGARVTLVDSKPPGSHASGKNAGHLNPLHLTPPALIPFALESFHGHTRFAEDLEALGFSDGGREPVRRILVALHEDEARDFSDVMERFKKREDFPARLLDRKSLLSLEPRVTRKAMAGLLLEGSLSVDAAALTRNLAGAACKLGATLLQERVIGLKTDNRRVCSVRLEASSLPCDDVVLATGPWVGETREWLGVDLPVRPIQGQLLRMKPPRGGLAYDLTHGADALYRRGPDEVWVGGTEEDAGFDENPTTAVREQLLAGAIRLMPEMAEAELLEHTAALRPMTPDRLPMVSRASGWENVILANGGGSKGLLLSAGVAERVLGLLGLPLPE